MQLRPQWNPGPQVFRINDPNQLYQAHFERNHVFSSKRRSKHQGALFQSASGVRVSFWKHFLAQTSLTEKPEPDASGSPKFGWSFFDRIWTNKKCQGWTQLHLNKMVQTHHGWPPLKDFFLNDLGGNSKWNATPPTEKKGNVLWWPKLATVQILGGRISTAPLICESTKEIAVLRSTPDLHPNYPALFEMSPTSTIV